MSSSDLDEFPPVAGLRSISLLSREDSAAAGSTEISRSVDPALQAEILAFFASVDSLASSADSLSTLHSLKFSRLLSLVSLLTRSKILSAHQRNLLKFLIETREETKFLNFFDEFKQKIEIWQISKEGGDEVRNAAKSRLIAPDFDVENFELIDSLKESLLGCVIEILQTDWEELFSICSTSDGKRISKAERNAGGMNSSNLVYGEVSFESLATVIWRLSDDFINRPTSGSADESEQFNFPATFVDLGSGTGRAIFACSSILNFSDFVGIEILEGLHEAAGLVHAKFKNEFLTSKKIPAHQKFQNFRFEHDSFLQFDWSAADIVFANSTCFEDELMTELAERATKLRPGAYFISLTKRLMSPQFKLISSTQYTMSWGIATVHVHRRIETKSKS